ncbi:MAG: BatA domain-containing protein [Candidatus Binataceae bacterium]
MGLLQSIGLLNPGALYLLAIVPALVLAYLARERPRQVMVSSVIAFRALHVMRGQRFGGRPRFNWTFFIELLILCLAALAMARPYIIHHGNPVAVVLDNSAAMQAETPAGKTRFQTTVAKVRDTLASDTGGGQVTVYLTAPQTHQLGGVYANADAAAAALDRVEPVDAPDDPAAVTGLLRQLSGDRHLGRIIFAGYRAIEPPVPARMTPITVGQPIANYAIGAFTLARKGFGEAQLRAQLTVANFSPAAQTLAVGLSGDGKSAGHAEVRLEPGEVGTLEFPNLAPASIYQAELQPADGLMLDNTAYAIGSSVRAFSVLFISPTAADGESLKSIPGITIKTVTPDAYSPKELASADLAIFEFTVPKELPAVNALLVMPPPGDPVFNFSVRQASALTIAGWPTTDPLTDGVNFRLLNIRSGEYIGEHPWMRAVVSGNGGGLMLSGMRQGHRFVATGFNPFPYLGKRNLPMSILTLNMLGDLAGFGSQAAGFRTGEPWLIPAGVGTVVQPSGITDRVTAGTLYTNVAAQGVYQLVDADGQKKPRAVNLADLAASDLENVPPLKIETGAAGAPSAPINVTLPLEYYVLGLILVLLVFEAVLVYRRRRPALGLEP